MEAYKPYVDYILKGGVAESAYILSKHGVICGTNMPIKELPKYEFQMEDPMDPNKKNKIIIDERPILLEALANNGVAKHIAGVRLYNQKCYFVNTHAGVSDKYPIFYYKKDHGGVCICFTNNFILIGTYDVNKKM